jgi:hypothetical protein
MRRANDSTYISHHSNPNQKVGIFTGADFCAEHEWGIPDIRNCLDMDVTLIGVAKRTNQSGEKNIYLSISSKNKDYAYLVIGREANSIFEDKKPESASQLWKKIYPSNKEKDLYCEWDERSVKVVVKGKENVDLLIHLYEAFKYNRGFLALGGTGVFNNGGLIIIDVNDISDKQKKAIEESDLDEGKLYKADLATGIKVKLTATQTESYCFPKSGCKWFALRARWNDFTGNSTKKTKHPVVYWLNPRDQERLNFGWFTVEELEQWIEGKGPIVK